MFLPIGDDNPKETTPFVHYGIMTVNVVVFFYSLQYGWHPEKFWLAWGLVPAEFDLTRLFTSMYVHGDFGHLFGNMLFLWVVGDNVEDRLGHAGYFAFYHLAGVAACLTHVAFTGSSLVPLIGASGAISGVMGAYAVFFPRAKIKIWYWVFFFFMGVAYVSAKWAVGLWFLEQVLLRAVLGSRGVSYDAHIGGIVFGVAAALVLRGAFLRKPDTVGRVFGTGRRQPRWRRTGRAGAEAPSAARPVTPAAGELQTDVDDNAAITASLEAGDPQLAYRYFTRAAARARWTFLDESVALRLADALVQAGSYGPAARVYEVMLETFPQGPDAPEAAFRLGVILSRAFEDYDRARPLLARVHQAHGDARRRQQALDEMRRIDAHLRRVIPFRRSH